MSPHPDQQFRILVVDESAPRRRLICGLLRRLSAAEVHEADGDTAGQEALSRYDYAAVVLTCRGGAFDAARLVSRIRTSSAGAPAQIILVADARDRAGIDAARDAGVAGFLAIPVTAEAVAASLQALGAPGRIPQPESRQAMAQSGMRSPMVPEAAMTAPPGAT